MLFERPKSQTSSVSQIEKIFRQFEIAPDLAKACLQETCRTAVVSFDGVKYTLGDLADAHFSFQLQARSWPAFAGKHLHFGSPEMFLKAITVFREGQAFIRADDETIIAVLNLARIKYPNLSNPPNWQTICGNPAALEKSYVPEGDTVVMVNISVNPDYKGQRLPERLVELGKVQLKDAGVKHIVGLFRPSDFGRHKLLTGQTDIAEYAALRKEDGTPQDSWLRSLEKNGMHLLTLDGKYIIDNEALVFTVLRKRFEDYKQITENSDDARTKRNWKMLSNGPFATVWQSEDVGTWHVDEFTATYKEQRILGHMFSF
jgi:hypothetical protein